jgi:hypothetical protein
LPNSEALESVYGKRSTAGDILILDSNEYIRRLKTEAFEVVNASTLLQKLTQGIVAPAESTIE